MTAKSIRLFRASVDLPPFGPGSSWSDDLTVATARRAQVLFNQGGFGAIWETVVLLGSTDLLDARTDDAQLRQIVGRADRSDRLRDVVHEEKTVLAAAGWTWAVFCEPDQPGAEYVYLSGPPLDAQRADLP